MKWFILLSLLGCTQVTSLNLRKHQFGSLPMKIIWFQVAGLDEDQVAMLRFEQSGERKTAFENNICVGKTWGYNLYDLRPTPEAAFMSQLTGKKNIKNNCEDAELRPIWSYLNRSGYNTGIVEIGAAKNQSLVSLNQCGEKGTVFLSSLYYWGRMTPPNGAATFHYTENFNLTPNQYTYDRSCAGPQNRCTSLITEDLKAIYEKFQKVSQKSLFIVRDFSYLAAVERKDFIVAKEILADLEKSYALALEATKSNPEYLILLTSGGSRYLELPAQGEAWSQFEKAGKNAQVKNTKLTNLVLASGARAENFCGMYEDANVFERILSGPKQQGLELKIINPFK